MGLGLELAAEMGYGVGAEYAEATHQRMGGEGDVRGVATGDGVADVIEQARDALLCELDQPPCERYVAIHLMEEGIDVEDRQRGGV